MWYCIKLSCTELNWIENWIKNWIKMKWIELNWIELNWIENWIKMKRNETKWTELNWIDINWTELNWIELNWIELNWIELNWIELNWIELNWIELNWTELTHSQLMFPLEVTTACHRGTMLWQKTYFTMLTSMYSICIISIHKYIGWLRKIWGRWYDIWYDFRMIRNNWKGEKYLTFSYD